MQFLIENISNGKESGIDDFERIEADKTEIEAILKLLSRS